MDRLEWLNRYVLRDYFTKSEFARNGCSFKYFASEKPSGFDGLTSDALCGRIVYTDVNGNECRSKCVIIKVMLSHKFRNKYADLMFANESFMYTTVMAFFAKLDSSITNLFAKFYHHWLSLRNDGEEGSIVLENLTEKGYRLSKSKLFLDITHLKLMLKNLGKFHAFSYQAKNIFPEVFFTLVDNFRETHHTCTSETPRGYFEYLNERYFSVLFEDHRYRAKIQEIRRMLTNPVKFFETVFTTRDEPWAVVCHGDFLRNNVLFRYNTKGDPVRVKFIDLANSRYCSPAVDLATVLYMNTDQKTRDVYWDELIDTYYVSLKNTFPHNDLVPSKDQILSEFKSNSLLGYLSVSFFIPLMLEAESNTNEDWLTSLFCPEFEKYKDQSWFDTPGDVSARVISKMAVKERLEKVIEVLKDIINRGFV